MRTWVAEGVPIFVREMKYPLTACVILFVGCVCGEGFPCFGVSMWIVALLLCPALMSGLNRLNDLYHVRAEGCVMFVMGLVC